MASEPRPEWQAYARQRVRVSQDQRGAASLVLLVPAAVWGAVAMPLGSLAWWVCTVFLTADALLLVALVRARKLGVGPLERAILARTLYENSVTTFLTSAGEIRTWMTEHGIAERPGRTPRRDDLGALIVRPSGVHAIVSDHGRVKDLLVIGVGAIADVEAARPASSLRPYELLRITFTTGARPLDLDPYPPTPGNTFTPYEHLASVTAESMRRVLSLPRRDDTSPP